MEQEVQKGVDYMQKAMEWLTVNGMTFLVNLLGFLLILLIGRLVIGWLCGLLGASLKRANRVSEVLEQFVVNVTRKVLWVVVIMIALQRLGVDIAPMIAGLGVTGFVVGFAFQESLGNLASGLMIALNQPFTIGDFVEVAGITGVVKEMNMMAVTVTTPDNKKVMAPNRAVWGQCITNYSALETRRVDLAIGISYGADIGKARECLLAAMGEVSQVLQDPAPTIEVVEMGDSSVNLVVRPWCKNADYWDTYFAASRKMKEALDAAGIEIPFPQMDVHPQGVLATVTPSV